MTWSGMLNWSLLWNLPLTRFKQVPNEWLSSKSQCSGLSGIPYYPLINRRGFVSLCFDFNLPKCGYGQGWLVWFLWLSAYSDFFFFKYLCLATYADIKPQLVLIISKSVFHVFPLPWELSPCTSAGQTTGCPLSPAMLNTGLWFAPSCFRAWPFRLKILVLGWRVGLGIRVQFFQLVKYPLLWISVQRQIQ